MARAARDPRWDDPTAHAIIAEFDLRAALQAAQLATTAAGGNADDACFDSDAYRQSSSAQRVFSAGCAPDPGEAPHFSRFVFWDGIHPTGAAHAVIGAALTARVDAAFANP